MCDHCGSVWKISWSHVCEVPKSDHWTPPHAPIWTDVAVWCFCQDHGVDPAERFDRAGWTALRGLFAETTVVSEDPLEIRVTVELDGDRLEVSLDDEGHVIDPSDRGD